MYRKHDIWMIDQLTNWKICSFCWAHFNRFEMSYYRQRSTNLDLCFKMLKWLQWDCFSTCKHLPWHGTSASKVISGKTQAWCLLDEKKHHWYYGIGFGTAGERTHDISLVRRMLHVHVYLHLHFKRYQSSANIKTAMTRWINKKLKARVISTILLTCITFWPMLHIKKSQKSLSKTITIPILIHQMRISTYQLSSVVLRPKKLEIQKTKNKTTTTTNTVPWNWAKIRRRIELHMYAWGT
jgi:hypothetical protein